MVLYVIPEVNRKDKDSGTSEEKSFDFLKRRANRGVKENI